MMALLFADLIVCAFNLGLGLYFGTMGRFDLMAINIGSAIVAGGAGMILWDAMR